MTFLFTSQSAEQRRRSSDYDAMEKGLSVNNLMFSEYEECNFTNDEPIFPSIEDTLNPCHAPSYEPNYDYYNEYSTTPLVYSWMPIVPGLDHHAGAGNLQNFEHIISKLKPQPLNISNASQDKSILITDQNAKLFEDLALNSSSVYNFQRIELLDSSKEVTATSFSHQLEDSCNAMDLNISCHRKQNEDSSNHGLSFNGKIPEVTSDEKNKNELENLQNVEEKTVPEKISQNGEISPQKAEEEEAKDESFELLKQEDSSRMAQLNEKSPETLDDTDVANETDVDSESEVSHGEEEKVLPVIASENVCEDMTFKSLEETDTFIKNNFQRTLSEPCAPPSISTLPLSLSEMLATYKQNLGKEPTSVLKSNSLFAPSHHLCDVKSMEWKNLLKVNAHGIMYNRSTDCEEIELMRLRYTDKFIKMETTSSYTHKNGPTSARKRVEKLRFLTQSPGSRLSHLANRRKVFSSAHLKSSAKTSQKSFGSSFLIDKS